MSWKKYEKADGEGDKEKDVGDEEVDERLRNVLEHLYILSKPWHLADQKHLKN
jgi:hypothetical protein